MSVSFHHRPLSWARISQALLSILLLFSLLWKLCPLRCSHYVYVYIYHLSHTFCMSWYPSYGENYKLWNFSLCTLTLLLPSTRIIYSLLCVNILLSDLFSKALSLCLQHLWMCITIIMTCIVTTLSETYYILL